MTISLTWTKSYDTVKQISKHMNVHDHRLSPLPMQIHVQNIFWP